MIAEQYSLPVNSCFKTRAPKTTFLLFVGPKRMQRTRASIMRFFLQQWHRISIVVCLHIYRTVRFLVPLTWYIFLSVQIRTQQSHSGRLTKTTDPRASERSHVDSDSTTGLIGVKAPIVSIVKGALTNGTLLNSCNFHKCKKQLQKSSNDHTRVFKFRLRALFSIRFPVNELLL